MDRVYLGIFKKNIPVPMWRVYLESMLEMTNKLLHRMRWAAYHFDRKADKEKAYSKVNNTPMKPIHRLRTYRNPPYNHSLDEIERKMLNLVKNIKFRRYCNQTQMKLLDFTNLFRNDNTKIIVSSDKTGNVYRMEIGFPRTLNQAVTLNNVQPVDFVLNLNVPFDIIIERIKGRWIHLPSGRVYHSEFNPPKVPGVDDVTLEPLVQRKDDKPETVKHRLMVYKELTQSVLDFYRKNQLLAEFTGNSTPEIWPKVRRFISTKLEPVQKIEYK